MGNLKWQQAKFSHEQSFGDLYSKKRKRNTPYPILKMRVKGASRILGNSDWVIWVSLDHKHPWTTIWQPLRAYVYRMCRHIFRNGNNSFHFHSYHSVFVSIWAYQISQTMFVDNTRHIVLWLTIMEGQPWLTLHPRSFSCWGREHFTFSFGYKGSQYFVYDYLQPVTHQITQDTWPRIVDAPLTLNLPWVYQQYSIIGYGIVHHSNWFRSLSSILIYFLPDHRIVL